MDGLSTYNIVWACIIGAPAAVGVIRFHIHAVREGRRQRERAARQAKYARVAMETRYYR